MSDFVHLHNHTEYSMLDGAQKIGELFDEVIRLGQPAVAATDHGNVFAHYAMWQEAAKRRKDGHNVKAILGVEAYVAPATRFDKKKIFWGTGTKGKKGSDDAKDVSGGGAFTHMTLIAQNALGLNALFEITSRASMEGQYPINKPRIDSDLVAETLAKYPGAVIIGTTGCPGGAVQTRLRLDQAEQARAEAAKWREILGPENYFLELMDHGLDLERNVRDDLLGLARYLKLPLLATNDSHYVNQDQAKMHDALLCVQMGTKISEINRMKFEGDGFYLRTAAEMRELFKELPEACDNAVAIAERIAPDAYDAVLNYQDDLLPQYPVPDGHTPDTYLREVAMAGLKRKYPDPEGPEGITQEAWDRVPGYELPVIQKMGYPSYMLMVWDFVNWARDKAGIRVGPGRGSAAGSGTSYALDITTVPTLEHGLLFERFINPERVSPPDVDVDFEKLRRDEVFRYLADRWGKENVCRIQTVNRIKAKAAIKDAARVLDVPMAVSARMTAKYPKPISGFDADLSCVTDEKHDRYADAEDFRTLLGKEERAQEVYDLALQLEGLVRSTGVHACGFVVSSKPLLGRIPLVWDEKSQQIVSGFPNAEVLEPMGYLKVDALGLDTMDVIELAVNTVVERHGRDKEEIDAALVALDNPRAYKELASGFTVGMFQVASGGMSSLLRLMHADRFEDISAGLALYRPGPMAAKAHTDYALRKTGRQNVRAIHPELKDTLRDILSPTYGVICYQEQIMRSVEAVADYSLGEADLLRKAMGKKKPEIVAKEQPKLFARMQEKGFSEEACQALWDVMEPFSAYAFNVAHTVSYGYITYATAWLKAEYPAEFMAALLTLAGDDKDKKALYLGECRRMGLKTLVPDINESGASFTVVGDDSIRFGLNAVSGIGPAAVDAIIAGRQDQPYSSFEDFLTRVPLAACTKNAVGALVKAGGFDSLGYHRRALFQCYEDAVVNAAKVKKNEDKGAFDLFSVMEETKLDVAQIPDVPEWEKQHRLAEERAVLGLYVSGHPLDEIADVLAGNRSHSVAELQLSDQTEGSVVLAGQLVAAEHNISKAGKRYAKLTLADLDGQCEVMVFGQTYGAYQDKLVPDARVVIKARLELRDDEEKPSIYADTIGELDMAKTARVRKTGDVDLVVVDIDPANITRPLVADLKELMQRYPGKSPVLLSFTTTPNEVDFNASQRTDMTVEPTREFVSELKGIVGGAVKVI